MPCTETLLPCEKLLFQGPIAKVGRFDCAADNRWFASTSPVHNHLFVVTRKPLWWRRSEGAFRFAEPGAALFHRPGGEIQRRAETRAGDISDWFGLDDGLFSEVLDRHGLDMAELTGRTHSLITGLSFRHRENRLMARLLSGQADSLETEECVLLLFEALCESFGEQPVVAPTSAACLARQRRLVDRARRELHARDDGMETEPVGLQDIADALGVSVFHLCRVFRRHTGLTLHAYRQRQRLGRALERMNTARQDLTTLALELGFSSHSHFTRAFKAHLGAPPSAFNGV